MTQSVLSRAKKADIIAEPFPYLVIENALDDAYYSELEEAYPSDGIIAGTMRMKSNTRYQLSAKNSNILPEIWQGFVEYHTSQSFYDEFISLFGEYIPNRLSWVTNSDTYTRGADLPKAPSDLALDCQIGINSPVTETSTVKGPHVDNRIELYAGLFYMRKDNDDSSGGSLEILKPKDPTMKIVHKEEMDPRLFEKTNEVHYRKNTFAMFLCSKYSIHAVSPRSVTPHSRRLVNIISEFSSGRSCF